MEVNSGLSIFRDWIKNTANVVGVCLQGKIVIRNGHCLNETRLSFRLQGIRYRGTVGILSLLVYQEKL